MYRQPCLRPLSAFFLPAIEPQHDAPQHQRQHQHRDWAVREAAPDRQMLLPAQQCRHRVNIGDIRSNDERGHGKASPTLQPHLPDERANKAMCEIIHAG